MRFAARSLNSLAALALFALAIYRAATLSFTVDEASTYVGYVHHGWQGIFYGPFDANNHILYSILEKFTRQWFGLSELSLRLPALLGAALFLWSLARLCAMLVPGLWFSFLAFLITAANPVTLDFMAAARGYGPALGLLTFALLQWIEWLEDGRAFRVAIASFALGLSTTANLTFAFASIATICAGALFLISRQRLRLIPFALLPALITAIALWWLPFQDFNREVLYFGTTSVYDSLESMELSLFAHDVQRGDPFGSWYTMFYLRWWILPYLIPALWCGTFVWMRRRATEGLAFATLVFFASCFGVWLAHAWLGVLYLQERTGLSVIFLFLLTWTAAIGVCWRAHRLARWLLAFPNLLLALIFLAQFAGQSDPRYFGPWQIDWKMNEIMTRFRDGPNPGEKIRLRTDWIYQSTAEYYRLRWKLPLEPIVREQDKFALDNADFFLLTLPSQEEVSATGMRVLYRDEVTGTTLLQK